MNIADAVNPFLFRHDILPKLDPVTQLVSEPGKATIISLMDELYIAEDHSVEQFATVISDDYDIVLHGLDVVLACDFLHRSRSANSSRKISIYCRTLTVSGGKNGVTMDVSAYKDERLAFHLQPDVARYLNNNSERAWSGDDIANALNAKDPGEQWRNWFQNDPGRGWATKGAAGGEILLACETLVLKSKLTLKADGARGNAGIGGQNVSNWMPGLIGGDAGRGGPGGDGGVIELTCARAVDANGNAVNLSDWVHVQCEAGEPGEPGLPGAAFNPDQHNSHYGSSAPPSEAGKSTGGTVTLTQPYEYQTAHQTVTLPDVSQVGFGCGPHYWALLYHRIKLGYLRAQPVALRQPRADDPGWNALGKLIQWGNKLSLPYGDVSQAVRQEFFADLSADSEVASKDPLARAMKLMGAWYEAGRTVWGAPAVSVSPLPLSTIFRYVDKYFKKQVAVRDFYIRLRKELDKAIQDNAAVDEISKAADYAVGLHEASMNALRISLYGDTSKGGVDAKSLLGDLNAADSACNTIISRIVPALKDFESKVFTVLGITIKDGLDALKSMLFVAGDAKAFIGMGVVEGLNLYFKAKNEITDNTGNSLAKSAVIRRVQSLEGDVNELTGAVRGLVEAGQAGSLDEAILASAESIDAYVSKFTDALGEVAQTVLDDVAALRHAVRHRNQLWMQYNNQLLQLSKEWEDYQTCLAKQQHIGKSPQELSANLLDTVQLYTAMYLGNLERTADLRANMLRKFAYVTLGADLPDSDFIGSVAGFWIADHAAASSMAEQSDNNWDVAKDTVIGSDESTSVRYRLTEYNAGTQSIVLRAPSAENRKSRYFIDIPGCESDQNRTLLRRLLSCQSVWIGVTPPVGSELDFTDANGNPGAAPPSGEGLFSYPMIGGEEWDMRISHVTPWIEGVETDGKDINFVVKLGTTAYILDSSKPQTARLFDYNGSTVSTEFAHFKGAKVEDLTLDSIGGGADGQVSDDNVDKRGVYIPFLLRISSPNPRAVTDLHGVHLRIHFRVIFRAPKFFVAKAPA